MKRKRIFIAAIMAGVMCFSLSACGSNKNVATSTDAEKDTSKDESRDTISSRGIPRYEGSTPRTIKIGTWYDIYYDSTHEDIYSDPFIADEETAKLRFDNLKAVEEKYNVRIEFENLTYEGIKESIETSIPAGKPDCDIYLTEPSFALPAIVKGYATDLEKVLPSDADILNEQQYLRTAKLNGIDGTYLMYEAGGESIPDSVYCLAFNKKILETTDLEDPNVMYKRGQWTWDKWLYYMDRLTQDTDGDETPDVYGFSSDTQLLFENLCMSNGTSVASSDTENISSKEVGEVLDYINKMYNSEKVVKPMVASETDAAQNDYLSGDVACWITQAHITNANEDLKHGINEIWCPWPEGPHGDIESNATKNEINNAGYIIPKGADDPYLIYCVFQDYMDYYGTDFEKRDTVNEWWHTAALTEENFNVMYNGGKHAGIDLWNSLGINYDFDGFINGDITRVQFQENYSKQIQQALDAMFTSDD